MIETVARFFQEGGFFMYPITAAMGFGLAVTLERAYYLILRFNVDGRKMYAELRKLIEAGTWRPHGTCAEMPRSRVSFGRGSKRRSPMAGPGMRERSRPRWTKPLWRCSPTWKREPTTCR